MEERLDPGKQIQIPSIHWNYQIIINRVPFPLALEMFHDDLVRPILIIKVASEKQEEDNVLEDKLKTFEGKEI